MIWRKVLQNQNLSKQKQGQAARQRVSSSSQAALPGKDEQVA